MVLLGGPAQRMEQACTNFNQITTCRPGEFVAGLTDFKPGRSNHEHA
jgi:hypothetical protein